MKETINQLGPRLREIRLKTGLSLREIARRLDVSPAFVSQIENGKSQPSVSTLYAFSKLLGVPVDQLFSGEPEIINIENSNTKRVIERNKFGNPIKAWDSSSARISAMNPTNRSKITMDSGVTWERLAATAEDSVNFMEINYEPLAETNKNGELISHDGYEYGYAIKGELEVTIGDLVLQLSEGHSIGFDSSIPHRFRNIGKVPFRGIWFVHGCTAKH